MSWVQVNLLARGLSRGWGGICRTALSGTLCAQVSLQAPRGLHCSAVTHKDEVWLVPRPPDPQKKPIKVPAMHEDLFRPSGNGEQDKASFLNAVRSFGEHNVRKRGHVDFIYLALRKMPEFGVERDLSVYNLLLDVFPKEVFRPRNVIQRIFVHYPRQQECGIAVLGEAHGPWVDLRRRSGWSDAKLAAYLISLERGQRSGRHGKPWEQVPKKPKRKKRRRRNVNCLKNVVIWYEDHKHRCPYEPHLAELDPTFGLYTTAVWQCEAGHRYFQDLHSPLKPLSDSEPDSDKVGNGLVAGSSDSSSSSSSSDSEDPPETQPAKASAAAAALTPTSPTGSSGLITQEGVHIPFDVHHVESLAEQGTPLCQNPAGSGPETLETVVCVPVPMQVGTGPGTLFENMPQEALGEVVASCPVSGMVPGSQVIIIAGPGYDALTAEGIHLNVAAGSGTPSSSLGEEVSCAMMESVAAYTQTEPEGTQHSTMDTTSIASIETKKDTAPCYPVEKENLYVLKEEKEDSVAPELAELAATVPESTEAEAEVDGEELDSSEMSAIIYEIPKEPEKRRRSKRSRVMDADGLLEMFHCPYEGCSQVYVALSSFQNHVNLVHRKGKTKVCPHPGCGKKFYLSNHLRRHMIIHSGIREFTCETCGKSFKRKNHLEVHRRTHTGETPLQCEICGYQCRQRASLNWHMKKHTAEVQYNFTCDRCGKRFEKLDSVKFHTLKSHPDHKPT